MRIFGAFITLIISISKSAKMQDDTYLTPLHAEVHHEWTNSADKLSPRPQYLLHLPVAGAIEPGQDRLAMPQEHFELVLIERGLHSWCDEQSEPITIDHPAIYLVPCGAVLHIRCLELETSCHYLSFTFRAHPNLCMGLCPSKREPLKKNSSDQAPRPRRHAAQATMLALSSTLTHWAEAVRRYLQSDEIGIHMFDFKLQELFMSMRLDYTRAMIDEFLQHYHCRISGFRSMVMCAYHRTMDVQELYALSSKLGINELAFKRSFLEEFGVPPREWISTQRARYIYHDLITTDKSISALSETYGFCSLSYFSLFCKENLGETPLQIRKRCSKENTL